jgi:hypothetical protein
MAGGRTTTAVRGEVPLAVYVFVGHRGVARAGVDLGDHGARGGGVCDLDVEVNWWDRYKDGRDVECFRRYVRMRWKQSILAGKQRLREAVLGSAGVGVRRGGDPVVEKIRTGIAVLDGRLRVSKGRNRMGSALLDELLRLRREIGSREIGSPRGSSGMR